MNETVLLVDDEPNVLSGLTRAIGHDPYQEIQYQVLQALSGPEALEILRENRVDVIVSDEQMPK